jgi:HK97 family phage prohead protease
VSSRPAGPLEFRSAQTMDVSLADRVIHVVAVPYGETATVPYQGRWIEESISNLAFLDVDKQENRSRIRATREHRPELLFGRVVTVDPLRPDGLHAEIKASRTALGTETLQLSHDGLLDASIAFRIPTGGERWEGRDRRRVVRALLHEVSMVAEPAYKGARVVSVRDANAALALR